MHGQVWRKPKKPNQGGNQKRQDELTKEHLVMR